MSLRDATLLILAVVSVSAQARAAQDPASTAAALTRRLAAQPVYAYIVPDSVPGSPGEVCDPECLKSLRARVQGRRGVKKATIEGANLKLELITGVFKADTVIQGLDGMKIEMRAPYKAIEIRFVPTALFPPIAHVEDDLLLVEFGEDVRKAIEEGVKYRPFDKMKCLGTLTGPVQNEAILSRYENEKRPPSSLIPFLAEADLDGDRRPDLYLRLEGLPEFVIFNRKDGLKAVPLTSQPRIEEIPHCVQDPARFAKPVQKSKIKCLNASRPDILGDAVERVQYNRSNQYVMWGKTGFVFCEPLGEGALPAKEEKKE